MAASWLEVWAQVDSLARFGIQPGLERMDILLKRLGHPERTFTSIQVAGTNGKGATAFALASLLQGTGHTCGLFTSPHVLHASERIRVGGQDLSEQALGEAWDEVAAHLDSVRPSYFETLTALALVAFSRAGVDFAVLECGLGGRWDATSAVHPLLSLLTHVGEDHLAILGPTLEDVARDKAHVAPPGGILLSAVREEDLARVVAEVAAERGARLVRDFQAAPVEVQASPDGATAVLCLLAGGPRLRLPVDTLSWREAGSLALQAFSLLADSAGLVLDQEIPLEASRWPGRFQVLSTQPPRVLDVAHNPPALARFVKELGRHYPRQRFHVLVAGMADKNLAGNVRELAPVMDACRILVVEGHGRAAGMEAWGQAALEARCPVEWVSREDVERLKVAVARNETSLDPWACSPLLVCGSFLAVSAWLGRGDLPPGL